MKILLSYSKRHFDPDLDPKEQEHWGSSASVLARSLYALLSRAKKSIFFAVNMHPKVRNRLLGDFTRLHHLEQSVASWDHMDEKDISRSLRRADSIICVGNTTVYNSYVQSGVPKTKIKMINYAAQETPPPKLPAKPKLKRFLYSASDIGLRKGFDIIENLFSHPSLKHDEVQLTVVGRVRNEYYQHKLDSLKRKFGPRLDVRGWVPSQEPEYADLLREHSFVIFPSLEEGQAGTVLEAMQQGLIPIITPQTGVDFSPLGSLEPALNSQHNRDILSAAIKLDGAAVRRLQQKTLDYYDEFHRPFKRVLAQTLTDAVNDQLYPKVTVTMPIFNKEHTIVPLLRELDRACRTYGNCELIIIFDGCKDRTEQRVRAFYRNRRHYPVSFEVTPNIFEVKTNNMGLKQGTGRYGIIIQDDNFVHDPNTFIEAVSFLEKNPRAVILGCLAGVNYYPRGTKNLKGPGQVTMSDQEVYWRQDEVTDPSLKHKFFEVDACMRGPLIIRKEFMEKHGYLDEIYVPLYQDDMDLGFRARKYGYKVYCGLFDVENKAFTMANYSAERNDFFNRIIKRNTDIFYKRWTPSVEKDYTQLNRVPIYDTPAETAQNRLFSLRQVSYERTYRTWGHSKHLIKRGLHKAKGVIHGG
jgi:glycosyltransferase involved in cell wall biosynthesis